MLLCVVGVNVVILNIYFICFYEQQQVNSVADQ